MLPTKANSNQTTPKPQTQYQDFLSKLNGDQGPGQHFDPDQPPILQSDQITFYLKPHTLSTVASRLTGHLAPLVRAAISAAWGDDAPGQILYAVGTEVKTERTYWPPDDEPDGDLDNDPDEYQGIYHNSEDAILQPDKLEYNQATQYYRKKWRPLLGPTLSELIRELRQRCHYKSKRNKFETTYKALATALGVSERTIKRALARDKDGQFKNEYLSCFIADIQVIRESRGKGEIRTKGTRFLIYLTDAITPEDREKVDDFRKGQNGT